LRGDTWPTIQIKQRNGNKYTKCPDDILQTARAEHLRVQKDLAAERKRRNIAVQDNNMDTSEAGTPRANAQSKRLAGSSEL